VERESERGPTRPIQGQLLRLSTHHTVAIYLRQGSIWVAEFIDGRGVLADANTWFRFNCGTLSNSHALRRMALESAIPLSAELVEQIEALHRPPVVKRRRALGQLVEAINEHLPRGRWATIVARRFR
jgi:hypothetical protein